MKQLYVLGSLLAIAACAQQPAPPMASAPPPPPPPAMAAPPAPPPMAAMPASVDGVYVGSLTLASAGLSDQIGRAHV